MNKNSLTMLPVMMESLLRIERRWDEYGGDDDGNMASGWIRSDYGGG